MSLSNEIQKIAGDIPSDIKIYRAKVITPVPIQIKLLECPQLNPSSDCITVAESLKEKIIAIEHVHETVEYEINPPLQPGDECLCIAYAAGQKFILVDRI